MTIQTTNNKRDNRGDKELYKKLRRIWLGIRLLYRTSTY